MAFKSGEDFKFSSEEIRLLDKAFKDETFCKLFQEYAEEINDPANRQLYEEEVITLEKQRGIDVTFIHPKPGYVIKTGVGDKKAFINICKNDHVGKPSYKKGCNEAEEKGYFWNIPYLLSPPREDIDRKDKLCNVYDAIFHPNTLYMAEKNMRFKKIVEETAISGIEEKFTVTFGKTLRYPKMKFKGNQVATVLRTRKDGGSVDNMPKNPEISSLINILDLQNSTCNQDNSLNKNEIENSGDSEMNSLDKSTDSVIVPTYIVKYKHHIDMQNFAIIPNTNVKTDPEEIVVEINLPLLTTSTNLQLDICEKKLCLSSNGKDLNYSLDINLPYVVNESNGNAKFDKKDRKLVVTLPVIRNQDTVHNHDNKVQEDLSVISEFDTRNNNTLEPENEIKSDELPGSCINQNSINDESLVDKIKKDHVLPEGSDLKIHECLHNFSHKQSSVMLPNFCCNQTLEKFSVVLLVNNVDPSSIQLSSCTCEMVCQIMFTSLGAGFMPFNYSLCLKLSNSERLKKCEIDISEDNVILNVYKHDECSSVWQNFLVGTSLKDLVEYYTLCEDTIVKEMEELQNGAEKAAYKSDPVSGEYISVIDVSSEAISFDINLRDSYNNDFKKLKDVDGESSKKSEKKLHYLKCHSDSLETDEFEEEKINFHGDLKSSTENEDTYSSGNGGLSPSSDDHVLMQRKRGILKYPRNWRTISESSDEVSFWSSVDAVDKNIVDNEGILGINDVSEDKPKKSVRFSDNVSQALFRANSSILGQRKKNQRKAKNKKKKSKTSDSASDSGESENWDSGDGSDGSSISETENVPECDSESDIANSSKEKFNYIESKDKIMKDSTSKIEDTTLSQNKKDDIQKNENDQAFYQGENKRSKKQKKKKVKGSSKKSTQVQEISITNSDVISLSNSEDNDVNSGDTKSENKCTESNDLTLILEAKQRADTNSNSGNSVLNRKDNNHIKFTNNIIIELE